MPEYLDVEITIYKLDVYSYGVQLQIADPRIDRLEPARRGTVGFNPQNLTKELENRLGDPEEYGRFLWDSLFSNPKVKAGLDKAFKDAGDAGLRIRLVIDSSAPELHAVRWETLLQPDQASNDARWLASDKPVLFSRLLPSAGRVPAGAIPQDQLRALVLVSNPTDLLGRSAVDDRDSKAADGGGWLLEPLDADKELQAARNGLGGIIKKELVSNRNQPGQASLEKLQAAVRDPGFDIIYLVCHGKILWDENENRLEPYLWLEASDGKSDVVPGYKLIECLSQRDVTRSPRLIVLASCQSAGRGGRASAADKEAALAALGPRLASQVVPAVLAIQDNISMETMGPFMQTFFSQLKKDGQIDRATAAARDQVRTRDDAWMPVLYMSLKSGSVWYTPRFAELGEESIWTALLASISSKDCNYLPILGPGLIDALLGTARDIASTWAQTYGYALAPRYRDEWPQVNQYVVKSASLRTLRSAWQKYLQARLQSRLPAGVSVDLDPDKAELTFDELFKRLHDPDLLEPHYLLAQLPIPIYVTTNQDDLLAAALCAVGKHPVVYVCQWKQPVRLEDHDPDDDKWKQLMHPNNNFQILVGYIRRCAPSVEPSNVPVPPNYKPSVDTPLVYHLFGHIRWPKSLVLTEDDYFDYLMLVNAAGNIVPSIDAALRQHALAFLGFQIDDWRFRVLLRSILTDDRLVGRTLNDDKSVAVQVNPEESTFGPDRARNYLEKYFQKALNIDSYWGSATDFVRDLWQRWQDM